MSGMIWHNVDDEVEGIMVEGMNGRLFGKPRDLIKEPLLPSCVGWIVGFGRVLIFKKEG